MSPAFVSLGTRVSLSLAVALAGCSATAPPPPPLWTAAEVEAEGRCQAGEATGCGDAGRSLLLANRSQRDVERALVLLEGACGGSDLQACTTLGNWYLQQEATPSQARARKLLKRACDAGVPDACAIPAPPP